MESKECLLPNNWKMDLFLLAIHPWMASTINFLATMWDPQKIKTMASLSSFTSIPHLHNLSRTSWNSKVAKG